MRNIMFSLSLVVSILACSSYANNQWYPIQKTTKVIKISKATTVEKSKPVEIKQVKAIVPVATKESESTNVIKTFNVRLQKLK